MTVVGTVPGNLTNAKGLSVYPFLAGSWTGGRERGTEKRVGKGWNSTGSSQVTVIIEPSSRKVTAGRK